VPTLPSDAGADPLQNLSVIVRDGTPFVVMGTRLYAQGQLLGKVRIERISETEIWLREGKKIRKVQMFPGITRRTVSTASANVTGSQSPIKVAKP
jgi:hypothetical protein